MNKICYLLFVFLMLANGLVHSQDLSSKMAAKQFESESGDTLNYRILIPDKPDSTKRFPVVIFLHGSGERGTDNQKQLTHGVWRFAADSVQQKHPSIVIAPQTPRDTYWGNAEWRTESTRLMEEPARPLQLVMGLLEQVQKEHPVDPSRIYVTGLSMGGFGTWNLVTRHPDTFAAAVPVCGGGDVTKAHLLADMPIWNFHGTQDNIVPPVLSRDMITAIRYAGGSPGFTEYPDVGHNAWDYAYREPMLTDWMFSKKLKKNVP